VRLLGDLEKIVIETDCAKANRDENDDPHVMIGKVGPEQRRYKDASKDHKAAHGRSTALRQQMRRRAVFTDRLALALLQAEHGNDPRTKEEHEQYPRSSGTPGPERDVPEDVERAEIGAELSQPG